MTDWTPGPDGQPTPYPPAYPPPAPRARPPRGRGPLAVALGFLAASVIALAAVLATVLPDDDESGDRLLYTADAAGEQVR
ncbi:hypothetical protein [Streptomyces specialis]|uniref:hypothetical protein n=1 Tax=Streptomyces specialis TaxID=498367 RepID=UPI000A56A3A8|nr:hypothetical protein [Streptomyces specialis]